MVNFEEAKERLKHAENQMIEAYLVRISQEYKPLSDKKRTEVLWSLERVVNIIERDDTPKAKAREDEPIVHEEENITPYDPNKAKNIREKMELSQKALASLLGISQRVISDYERYKVPTLKNLVGKRYLQFCKDNGYNPFDI